MSGNQNNYVRADSRNLPNLDTAMLIEFFTKSDSFNAPEVRGVKTARSMRDEYVNSAIGYVRLVRKSINSQSSCTVVCDVCPEQKINNKNYTVVVEINETTEEITNAQCQDCPASLGTCKHATAFLMWLNKKTIEPSPTSVISYWGKPRLSRINSNRCATLSEFGKRIVKVSNSESVASDFLKYFQNKPCNVTYANMMLNEPVPLSLHCLGLQFKEKYADHSFKNFLNFLKRTVTSEECKKLCENSISQSDSPLWHELRYGRITASVIYPLSRAVDNKTLIKQVLGAAKVPLTTAIKRGKSLEHEVRTVLGNILNIKFKDAGFLIYCENPILGASPDGISEEYVVEIKCPASKNTVKNYMSVKNNKVVINPRYRSQLQLQMLLFQKKKGIFCIADPDFEKNKRVEFMRCRFRPKFVSKLIQESTDYWKTNIFPKIC